LNVALGEESEPLTTATADIVEWPAVSVVFV